jgi:predicted transcriptional regulator
MPMLTGRRRDKLDILRDILILCSKESLVKTHIIYRSKTNFNITTAYLNWLIAHEFLIKKDKFYVITPNGLELLSNLSKFVST